MGAFFLWGSCAYRCGHVRGAVGDGRKGKKKQGGGATEAVRGERGRVCRAWTEMLRAGPSGARRHSAGQRSGAARPAAATYIGARPHGVLPGGHAWRCVMSCPLAVADERDAVTPPAARYIHTCCGPPEIKLKLGQRSVFAFESRPHACMHSSASAAVSQLHMWPCRDLRRRRRRRRRHGRAGT